MQAPTLGRLTAALTATLGLAAAQAADNDHFQNATDLGSTTSATLTGSLHLATIQAGEPEHPFNYQASLWWKWTAPDDGAIRLESTIGARPVLYRGTTLATLVSETDTVDRVRGWHSNVDAGVEYRIAHVGAPEPIAFESSLRFEPAPPNDHIRNATSIQGLHGEALAGNTLAATREFGERQALPEQSGSLWWRLRPDSDVTARFVFDPDLAHSAQLLVFTSPVNPPDVALLEPVYQVWTGAEHTFQFQAGTTYYIAGSHYDEEVAGLLRATLEHTDLSPTNDNFADAIDLGSQTFASVVTTTDGAGREVGEPVASVRPGATASLWWRWTAPADGALLVSSTLGRWHAHRVTLYSGSSLAALTELSSSSSTEVETAVTAGTTYYIAAANDPGGTGPGSVEFEFQPIPANDDFANAAPLPATTTFSFVADNRQSSREPGEALHGASADPAGSVWYSWRPPVDGDLFISTEFDPGAGFRLRYTLYSQSGGAPLTALELTRHQNNYWTTVSSTERYYLAVTGDEREGDDTGRATFNFTLMPHSTGNDHFADAEDLGSQSIIAHVRGNLSDATIEPGEPDPWNRPDRIGSRWWRWRPPSNGYLAVEKDQASSWSIGLTVFKGTSLESLVVQQNPGPVAAGDNLWIAMSTSSPGSVGGFGLTFYPSIDNDALGDALPLPAGGVTAFRGYTFPVTSSPDDPELVNRRYTSWYTWTPQQDASALLDRHPYAPSRKFVVFEENALGQLVPSHPATEPTQLVKFFAAAGTTYYIAVVNSSAKGQHQFSLTARPPEPHDRFEDALDLGSAVSAEFSGDLTLATADRIPTYPWPRLAHSAWARWTPPADGVLHLRENDSHSSLRLNLFAGTTLDDLVHSTPLPESQTWFNVDSQTTYYIGASIDGFVTPRFTFNVGIDFFPHPPNDSLTTPHDLTEAPVTTVQGTTLGAIANPAEPALSNSAHNSVWYAWSTPVQAIVKTSLVDAPPGHHIEVFRSPASSPDARPFTSSFMTPFPQETRNTRFLADAGETYLFRVSCHRSNAAGFTLSFETESVLPNDSRSTPAPLPLDSPVPVSGTVAGASLDPSEPPEVAHLTFPDPVSVWYRWQPTEAGAAIAKLTTESELTTLLVFERNASGALTRVPSGYPSLPPREQAFIVDRNRTYLFAVVGGLMDERPGFALSLRSGPPVPNDHFEDATRLVGDAHQIEGSLTFATRQAEEPGGYGGSVWFDWVPATSGLLSLWSLDDHVTLALYEGDAIGALTPLLRLIPDLSTVSVTAGESYKLSVQHNEPTPSTQPYQVVLDVLQPPSNDDFENALALPSALQVEVASSTVGATLQPDEPGHQFPPSSGASLWWTWTAPADTEVAARLGGTTGGTISPQANLRVYSGADIGSLALLAHTRLPHTDTAVFTAAEGTTYYLSVATPRTHTPFTLTIEALTPPLLPPENDNFHSRTLITTASAIVETTFIGSTREPREPGNPAVRNSLWWEWRPPHGTPASVFQVDRTASIEVYYSDDLDRVRPSMHSLERAEFSRGINLDTNANRRFFVRVTTSAPPEQLHTLTFHQPEPVAVGDRYASRIVLPAGAPLQSSATLVGAGIDFGEPYHGLGGQAASVWWEWTPTISGRYLFKSSNYNIKLAVYSGSELGSLTRLADAERYVFADLEAGTPVSIAAIDPESPSTSFRPSARHVTLSVVSAPDISRPPPAHDQIETALPWAPALPATKTVNNWDATANPGDPTIAGDTPAATLWFSWIADDDGDYTLHATGRTGVLLGVFRPEPQGGLIPVAEGTQRLTFSADAGDDLRFLVGSTSSGSEFDIHLRPANLPLATNDAFAGAIPLVSGTTVRGDSALATVEQDEPLPRYPVHSPGSLWYTWQHDETGVLELVPSPGSPTHVFSIYQGVALDRLRFVQEFVRTALFRPQAGVRYWIASTTTSPSGLGPFAFEVAFTSSGAPPNDAIYQAVELGALESPFVTAATTDGASFDRISPWARRDVWWTFQVPEPQHVAITARPSDPDAEQLEIDLYRGNMARQPIQLTASAQGTYVLEPGVQYHLSVSSDFEDPTDFDLTITPIAPPPNDTLGDAHNFGFTADASVEIPIVFSADHEANGTYGNTWFRWISPGTAPAVFSVEGPVAANSNLYIYTSIDGDPPQHDFSRTLGTATTFEAKAGTVYWIRLRTRNDHPPGTQVQVSLRTVPRPTNTQFENRTEIPSEVPSITSFSMAGSGRYAWFSWRPPVEGYYYVGASETDNGATRTVEVFSGEDEQSLTEVAPPHFLSPGESYTIRVNGSSGTTDVRLEIIQILVPANDAIADATPLFGSSVTIETSHSRPTVEAGEPPHLVQYRPSASRWWTWSPPHTAITAFDRDADDITVFVTGPENPTTLHPVPIRQLQHPWSSSIRSRAFQAELGRVYMIAHVASNRMLPPLTLALEQAPPNDRFAQAVDLGSAVTASFGFDTTLATFEGNDPHASDSLWYSWTAPADGTWSFAANTVGGTAVRSKVFKGASMAVLNTVAENRSPGIGDGTYDITTFDASAGTSYFLSVAATGDATSAPGHATLTPALLPSYEAWADTSITGPFGATHLPLADPDHDTVPNLLEMAFGTDPTDPGSVPPPQFVTADPTTGRLNLTYARPRAPSPFTFTYEQSPDASTWNPTPPESIVTESVTPLTETLDAVTVTISVTPGNAPTLLRVRATLTE